MAACEKHKIKLLMGCVCRASRVLLAVGKENNNQNTTTTATTERKKMDFGFSVS
jgi:hypothetical protein